jgi:5-methylcytosine-specific restriction endonuclease McrA
MLRGRGQSGLDASRARLAIRKSPIGAGPCRSEAFDTSFQLPVLQRSLPTSTYPNEHRPRWTEHLPEAGCICAQIGSVILTTKPRIRTQRLQRNRRLLLAMRWAGGTRPPDESTGPRLTWKLALFKFNHTPLLHLPKSSTNSAYNALPAPI